MYDVAIIGLGPAGSFLARHLSKALRVIALDRKPPEGEPGYHKPCGGLLAPDAQKSLSRFNMSLPKEVLVGPQIFSVRTIDFQTGLIRHYQRHYINIDRHRFDQWLIGQIPDHVEVRRRAVCTEVARENGGFRVDYLESGQGRSLLASQIVGADGASSIVRRALCPSRFARPYLAIQQEFADAHDSPFFSCIFDRELTDSYAWGLSKDDGFIFGGAFSVKTGKRDFELLKEKARRYGFQLGQPVHTQACLALRPRGPGDFYMGDNDAFFVGEAAGFISPSSLEGISYAIDSGYLLAQCLNIRRGNTHAAYRSATRGIRIKLLGKCVKRPFMYQPLLRRLVMASGISSISMFPPPGEA